MSVRNWKPQGNFAENHPEFEINVQYLEKVQPKELEASEIEIRLGATGSSRNISTSSWESFYTRRRTVWER